MLELNQKYEPFWFLWLCEIAEGSFCSAVRFKEQSWQSIIAHSQGSTIRMGFNPAVSIRTSTERTRTKAIDAGNDFVLGGISMKNIASIYSPIAQEFTMIMWTGHTFLWRISSNKICFWSFGAASIPTAGNIHHADSSEIVPEFLTALTKASFCNFT